MNVAAVVLILLFALGASAQTSSCFPHCQQCQVAVADLGNRKILETVQFSPLTGEEELTNRIFRIPGTRLTVTASVFFTDESMASRVGYDSMKLGLAVSRHGWPQAFASPSNAVAEVTLNNLDTARVQTNLWSGGRRLLVSMECKDGTPNLGKE